MVRRGAVDVAVVEVGLLGRYDATNVVDADVAVVTNVGPGPHRRRRATGGGAVAVGEGRHHRSRTRCWCWARPTPTSGRCSSPRAARRPVVRGVDFDVRATTAGRRRPPGRRCARPRRHARRRLPAAARHATRATTPPCAVAAVEAFFDRPLDPDVARAGLRRGHRARAASRWCGHHPLVHARRRPQPRRRRRPPPRRWPRSSTCPAGGSSWSGLLAGPRPRRRCSRRLDVRRCRPAWWPAPRTQPRAMPAAEVAARRVRSAPVTRAEVGRPIADSRRPGPRRRRPRTTRCSSPARSTLVGAGPRTVSPPPRSRAAGRHRAGRIRRSSTRPRTLYRRAASRIARPSSSASPTPSSVAWSARSSAASRRNLSIVAARAAHARPDTAGRRTTTSTPTSRSTASWSSFITRGPAVVLVVEGPEDTWKVVRTLMGTTNPRDAAPGTIRGDLGILVHREPRPRLATPRVGRPRDRALLPGPLTGAGSLSVAVRSRPVAFRSHGWSRGCAADSSGRSSPTPDASAPPPPTLAHREVSRMAGQSSPAVVSWAATWRSTSARPTPSSTCAARASSWTSRRSWPSTSRTGAPSPSAPRPSA